MTFLGLVRTTIRFVGVLDSVLDEFERERAQEQAKKAAAHEKMAKIYQTASNGPFHK